MRSMHNTFVLFARIPDSIFSPITSKLLVHSTPFLSKTNTSTFTDKNHHFCHSTEATPTHTGQFLENHSFRLELFFSKNEKRIPQRASLFHNSTSSYRSD